MRRPSEAGEDYRAALPPRGVLGWCVGVLCWWLETEGGRVFERGANWDWDGGLGVRPWVSSEVRIGIVERA